MTVSAGLIAAQARPPAFVRFNEARRAAALDTRACIAAVVASHAPRVPTAREVLRALIPDITAKPPLSVRAVQWHMARLDEAQRSRAALRVARVRLPRTNRRMSNRAMNALTIEVPKLGFSLAELEIATGLSRATLYRLIGSGELETVKVRGRRLVPSEHAQALIEGTRRHE